MPETAGARRALIALVLLCLIWGYAWIAMKFALRYAGPFYTAALRSGVATVCLFGVMFLLRRDLRLRAPLPVLLVSMLQGAFIALTLWALSLGGVGRVAVLNFTMPFWVVLLAWPVLGERVRGTQWVAVAVAFAGLLCVAQPWELGDKFASGVLGICSGFSWSLATIMVKRHRNALQAMDTLGLTAWQLLCGTLPLLLLAWIVPERAASWTPQFWAAIAYLGVVGTALAWLLWTFAITKLPASVASLNTLAIPALAVLFAWWQFDERPSPFELIGMLFIALGLLLLWWTSRGCTPCANARAGAKANDPRSGS